MALIITLSMIASFLCGLLVGLRRSRAARQEGYDAGLADGKRAIIDNKKRLIRTAYNVGLIKGAHDSRAVQQ